MKSLLFFRLPRLSPTPRHYAEAEAWPAGKGLRVDGRVWTEAQADALLEDVRAAGDSCDTTCEGVRVRP